MHFGKPMKLSKFNFMSIASWHVKVDHKLADMAINNTQTDYSLPCAFSHQQTTLTDFHGKNGLLNYNSEQYKFSIHFFQLITQASAIIAASSRATKAPVKPILHVILSLF